MPHSRSITVCVVSAFTIGTCQCEHLGVLSVALNPHFQNMNFVLCAGLGRCIIIVVTPQVTDSWFTSKIQRWFCRLLGTSDKTAQNLAGRNSPRRHSSFLHNSFQQAGCTRLLYLVLRICHFTLFCTTVNLPAHDTLNLLSMFLNCAGMQLHIQ